MSTNADTPKRLTPTERLHEITLAALDRRPVKASEEVEVSRNAKGDWQLRVAGVKAEDETMAAAAKRAVSIARELDKEFPLSRSQEYGRKTLPNEK